MESKAGFFDRGPFGHFTWNPLTVCQSCIQVGEIWWNLIVCFYLCTFKYILVHCVCNTFFIHTHFTSCIHLKLYGCFLSELFWRHFNMYERNAWYDEFSLHMVLWTSEIRLMKYVQTFWLLLQKKTYITLLGTLTYSYRLTLLSRWFSFLHGGILLMVQKSQATTWHVENPVENGMNNQPQLVSLRGFFHHRQYLSSP